MGQIYQLNCRGNSLMHKKHDCKIWGHYFAWNSKVKRNVPKISCMVPKSNVEHDIQQLSNMESENRTLLGHMNCK